MCLVMLQTLDAYINETKICDDGIYATEVEIFFMSLLLNTPICLYRTGTGWNTHNINRLFNDSTDDENAPINIYLNHTGHIHFDVVLNSGELPIRRSGRHLPK